jgi:hypothetical protein
MYHRGHRENIYSLKTLCSPRFLQIERYIHYNEVIMKEKRELY